MSRILTAIASIVSILLCLAVLGGLFWANTVYVSDHPNEKDFLIPWIGARTFLQYGVSPYDEQATQRAQVIYYGRLAEEGEDPLRLDVPFFVEIFYFPFALITDYVLARSLWMVALEVAQLILAFLALQLTSRRLPVILRLFFMVFAMLWPFAILPLINGSAVVFSVLAVIGSLAALRDDKDELAGGLLVFASFRPLVTGLFFPFVLWWMINQRRWRILAGMSMVFGLLLITSFIFLPGWFMPWLRALIAEFEFNSSVRTTVLFTNWFPAIGKQLAWMLTALIVLVLILEWGRVRRGDYRHYLWTASLTMALSPLTGLPSSPADYLLLFLPLTFILSIIIERWKGVRGGLLVSLLLLLLLAGFWLATNSIAAFFLILPFALIIGLYWMRWWAVHPPVTWSDSFVS